MRLMDADVCIDLLRDHPPALAWFASLTETVAVPGFAALELIAGCRNRADLRGVWDMLADLTVIWPMEADMERALRDYAPLRLSHGLGGFDALIAATAVAIGAELLTFNARHFSAVPGLTFSAPYMR